MDGECISEGAYGETWEDKSNDVYTLTFYAGNEETGGTGPKSISEWCLSNMY